MYYTKFERKSFTIRLPVSAYEYFNLTCQDRNQNHGHANGIKNMYRVMANTSHYYTFYLFYLCKVGSIERNADLQM